MELDLDESSLAIGRIERATYGLDGSRQRFVSGYSPVPTV